MSEGILQLASFRLKGQLYGIDLGFVQEYVEFLPSTQIPDNDHVYVGLANLRGQIISLLDLNYLLSGEASPHSQTLMIIRNNRGLNKTHLVFEKHPTSEESIGIIVEERGYIIEVDKSEVIQAPDHGADDYSKYYKSVAKLDDEVLIILDLKEVIGLKVEGTV